MSIRLFIDEDAMSAALVLALQARGIDTATAWERGTTGYSDEQQLELAQREGRVLYSFNIKDYLVLHARFLEQGRQHAGIILTPQKSHSVGEQTRRLLLLIASLTAEQMQNRLEFLSSWQQA